MPLRKQGQTSELRKIKGLNQSKTFCPQPIQLPFLGWGRGSQGLWLRARRRTRLTQLSSDPWVSSARHRGGPGKSHLRMTLRGGGAGRAASVGRLPPSLLPLFLLCPRGASREGRPADRGSGLAPPDMPWVPPRGNGFRGAFFRAFEPLTSVRFHGIARTRDPGRDFEERVCGGPRPLTPCILPPALPKAPRAGFPARHRSLCSISLEAPAPSSRPAPPARALGCRPADGGHVRALDLLGPQLWRLVFSPPPGSSPLPTLLTGTPAHRVTLSTVPTPYHGHHRTCRWQLAQPE